MAISEDELTLDKFLGNHYYDNPPVDKVDELLEKLNNQRKRGAEVLSIGYIPKNGKGEDYYSFVLKYRFSKDSFAGQICVSKETAEQYLLEREDLKERSEEINEFLKTQRQGCPIDLPL